MLVRYVAIVETKERCDNDASACARRLGSCLTPRESETARIDVYRGRNNDRRDNTVRDETQRLEEETKDEKPRSLPPPIPREASLRKVGERRWRGDILSHLKIACVYLFPPRFSFQPERAIGEPRRIGALYGMHHAPLEIIAIIPTCYTCVHVHAYVRGRNIYRNV